MSNVALKLENATHVPRLPIISLHYVLYTELSFLLHVVLRETLACKYKEVKQGTISDSIIIIV